MSTELSAADGNALPQSTFTSVIMAISMIVVSEIGDKTFLIAALMAMRHSRLLVFSSAAASLTIMTILSGVVGHTFVSIISERCTHFLAGMLFLIFGYKLSLEGLEMSKDAGVEEELAEVEEEITVTDINTNASDLESGGVDGKKHFRGIRNWKDALALITEKLSTVLCPIWIQIFSMIFVGELGDRSQISIIAMASDSDYWYVIFGAVIGHLLCTGLAVIGGKFLATKISMRTITLGGAFSFIIFAIHHIYEAFHMKW